MSLQIQEARKVQSFSYIIKITTICLLGLDKTKREMMLLYRGSISAGCDEIALRSTTSKYRNRDERAKNEHAAMNIRG